VTLVPPAGAAVAKLPKNLGTVIGVTLSVLLVPKSVNGDISVAAGVLSVSESTYTVSPVENCE